MISGCFFLVLVLSLFRSFAQPQDPKAHFLDPNVLSPNTLFKEVFDDQWTDRWVVTSDSDYQGKWRVGSGAAPYGAVGDNTLIVDTEARKHGIIAKFDRVLDNTDKDLIVQYELRLPKDFDCGGAYIKLLTASSLPSPLSSFNNQVPYTIMFGPDRCGNTNKVHFIIRHQNPISHAYEEKHLKNPPPIKTDTMTHLYRLKIGKDNHFYIQIDDEEVVSGNLLQDFLPPINPPKEIDDPTDKKPANWVDDEKIPDPNAVKPDDWDETAPATIVDIHDKKPDTWLDDEPMVIPDPSVTKPADWDDELDGDWEAPSVPNPKCEDGCGEWKPRQIPNPDYKGKWHPPLIDNPDYIGEWTPRQIPNPNYFEDKHPHNLEPIGAIGIEIWTMKSGITFDNILITHEEEEAKAFTELTWKKKHKYEENIRSAEEAQNSPSIQQQMMGYYKVVSTYVSDPQNLSVVVGTLIVAILVPILICWLIPSGKNKGAKENKNEEDKNEEDEAEEDKNNEEDKVEKEKDQEGKEQKANKKTDKKEIKEEKKDEKDGPRNRKKKV